MHIKLVVNSFPRASETFLFNLVTGLENRGVKVTVCAMAKTKDSDLYKHKLREWSGNIQFIPLKPNNISDLIRVVKLVITDPLFFFKMVRMKGVKKGFGDFIKICALLKGKPDIIHFSFSGIGIAFLDCIEYLRKSSLKTVVSCRGSAEKVKPLLDPERGKKLELLFSKVDLVHCVSRDMRDALVLFGLVPAKTFVNYPSIEIDKFLRTDSKMAASAEQFSIVTTGRLHFQKGYIFALQAMEILKNKGFKFIYHILGEGPDRAMITFAIHELGLSKQIILHGRVSSLEVMEHLNKADVFLLSSIYEGVANAALEAMAMEVPLVTTKAGGMAEVVHHKQNGMIVECFNGLAIADAIEELLVSRELKLLLAKNGRLTVEKDFTLNKQIDVFINQYRNLLNVS
jgi:colanic acid/amylovoran biosynthesis glycosyltransferase